MKALKDVAREIQKVIHDHTTLGEVGLVAALITADRKDVRKEALEEAARIADGMSRCIGESGDHNCEMDGDTAVHCSECYEAQAMADSIAAAIRRRYDL